ncbi:hypothetical protein V5N11_024602 [Cardamine amara subsp. amara]|uniref:Uncharacterized protein n=1 Tax=Cardamine amara subsp. amara TaxID=228776 RepID=A0ABD0ZZD4_CARAN
MQQNSFFLGHNYSNRDTTDARPSWSLCPIQDSDTVLTNRYGVSVNEDADDTLSLLYCDLYLRQQLKETMKRTMLVHESVFESQIHELHRLYWRQKELMMEMERTRHHEALYLSSGFPSHRTHCMNTSVFSTYQNRNFRCEEYIPNQIEAVDNVDKSEKKVLDLELPVFEYNDREEERGDSTNGEVDVVPNFLKEQSLESGKQNKLLLDLNEPPKIDEQSDYVFNQFLCPVTSNEVGEEYDSIKGSNGMNEVQGSVKCRGEYGIDLNMSPLSSNEEETIVRKFETKKSQESLSVSLHGNHKSNQPRVVVQALPCSTSRLLLAKQYKPLMRGSRPRKKVKLGPTNKTFKGSDLDPHSSAQAISESQSNQASMEKGSSTSTSSKVKSARNWTNLGKKRCCKPQMKSSEGHKVVVKKSGRTKRKKSRKISLVKEGHYQEVSAAEAIVDISRKSGRETADCITSLSKNLLWFAEITSSVAEDYEIDSSETMAEMKQEKHKKNLRLNSSGRKTTVSSFVFGKQKRSQARQGKRKFKDDQDTFSECEANEDLQVIGKLIEASELKWNRGIKDKSKSFPPKLVDAFTSSVDEKPGVDWGAIKKRRRGSRIPATDFQHMIINQVV